MKIFFEIDEVMSGVPAMYHADSFKNRGHIFDGRDKENSFDSPIPKDCVIIIARKTQKVENNNTLTRAIQLISEILAEVVHHNDGRLAEIREILENMKMDEEIINTTMDDGSENHHHKTETSEGDDVFDGPAEECPHC